MPDRGSLVKLVGGGLLLLLIGLLAGRAIPQAPVVESVRVTFPGGGAVTLDTSVAEVGHETLLAEIFADESRRAAAVDWLRGQELYAIEDAGLVDAIGGRLCPPIPEQPLEQRTAAARACAEIPVAAGLRRLAEQRAAPFHHLGVTVRVGVPEERPLRGRAAVCEGSDLQGETLRLTYIPSGASLEVEADWGTYDCTEVEGAEYPDLQLNPFDAFEIFPRPLARFHQAVAVIVE